MSKCANHPTINALVNWAGVNLCSFCYANKIHVFTDAALGTRPLPAPEEIDIWGGLVNERQLSLF